MSQLYGLLPMKNFKQDYLPLRDSSHTPREDYEKLPDAHSNEFTVRRDAAKQKLMVWSFIVVGIVVLSMIATNITGNNVFRIKDQHSAKIPKPSKSNTDHSNTKPDTTPSLPPKKSSKPHVIFLLADDMGFSGLGTDDGYLDFAAPVLSNLALEGIVLKNYYAQEVCTPARASLLTGRLPLSIGMQYFMVQSAIPWGLDKDETTMAQVFLEAGYNTHMLGKWHLGHYSARLLPTARGFETFLGMLNGESYYWSKRNVDHPDYKDFLTMDKNCYSPYEESDFESYSTHVYRDKALQLISDHDSSKPMFLFMSFQAVHDPFSDILIEEFSDGIPSSYLDDAIYNRIKSTIKGKKRQQYVMALNVMDQAVQAIIEALRDKGMYENSIIVFSSDNGGCYGGGGMNGDLRGVKGSLFEGGVKVDAFIHSPLLPVSSAGTTYDGLFHISDWFPTLMNMIGINFKPNEGYELDGVSHYMALTKGRDPPRSAILYNYYDDIDFYDFDIWTNGSFAIRNERYKLLHTFDSRTYGAWYADAGAMDSVDDDVDVEIRCAPQLAQGDGDFTYFLFDLIEDPNETTNLYNSKDEDVQTAKRSLYGMLPKYLEKATEITNNMRGNYLAFSDWDEHDGFIVPYVTWDTEFDDDYETHDNLPSYPNECF